MVVANVRQRPRRQLDKEFSFQVPKLVCHSTGLVPYPSRYGTTGITDFLDAALGVFSSRAPKLVQRRQRGLALRVFLAFSFAAAEFDAPMINRTFKKPVMVRAADGLKLILRRLGRTG